MTIETDKEARDKAFAHYVRAFGETRGVPMFETFCKKVGLDPYPPQPNPDPVPAKPVTKPEPPKKAAKAAKDRGF